MGYFVSNALQSNFGINFQSLALAKIEECLVKFSKKGAAIIFNFNLIADSSWQTYGFLLR